jgi:hypothetical protein
MCFLGVKKSPPFEGGDLGVVETGLLSCIKLEKLIATTPGPSLHRRGVLLALVYNRTQVWL